MKQFELNALGLQELEAKEQIETTGGELLAIICGVITVVGALVYLYDNRETIYEGFEEGYLEGYAVGRYGIDRN